jgi:predicted membrane-bound spermidine synthase
MRSSLQPEEAATISRVIRFSARLISVGRILFTGWPDLVWPKLGIVTGANAHGLSAILSACLKALRRFRAWLMLIRFWDAELTCSDTMG